jgi:hypothetical protein
MPECPAISELKEALYEVFPWIELGTVRNDGSRHTAGLAMDIMLNSKNPSEKVFADQIIEACIATHSLMGWGDILYTDWNGGKPFYFTIPGAPPYGGKHLQKNLNKDGKLGKAHEDHIHIDWWTGNSTTWPPACKKTGFKAKLTGHIRDNHKWLDDYMSRVK